MKKPFLCYRMAVAVYLAAGVYHIGLAIVEPTKANICLAVMFVCLSVLSIVIVKLEKKNVFLQELSDQFREMWLKDTAERDEDRRLLNVYRERYGELTNVKEPVRRENKKRKNADEKTEDVGDKTVKGQRVKLGRPTIHVPEPHRSQV